jgi:hypothetical protein
MADVMPNYDLELQRLELERAQLFLNIQTQEFRISQIKDETDRIKINIEATRVSIAELDKTIDNLRKK